MKILVTGFFGIFGLSLIGFFLGILVLFGSHGRAEEAQAFTVMSVSLGCLVMASLGMMLYGIFETLEAANTQREELIEELQDLNHNMLVAGKPLASHEKRQSDPDWKRDKNVVRAR